MTLYLDCQRVETLDLLRGDDAVVSTAGVTVFGTRLLDEDVFEVGRCKSLKIDQLLYLGIQRISGSCLCEWHLFIEVDKW